jgi:hypothetical protein
MFKIIGGDGREYGPVPGAQIRQWISEGRANGQTRAALQGTADFKPLSEFTEFADLFAPKTPAAPTPAAVSAPPIPAIAPPPEAAAPEPDATPVPAPAPQATRFFMIGGDGRQYGPATTQEVRHWIATQRANAATRAMREGAGEWRMLADFSEFADLLGLRAGTAPVPPLRMDGLSGAAPSNALAAAIVNAPAIFMIIVNALTVIGALVGVAGAFMPAEGFDFANQMKGIDPELQRAINLMVGLPVNLVALAIGGVCLAGSISMLSLRRHTFCVVCAVITMLNCSSCCCGLGLAAGIWSLVVLNKPEVRDAFK